MSRDPRFPSGWWLLPAFGAGLAAWVLLHLGLQWLAGLVWGSP